MTDKSIRSAIVVAMYDEKGSLLSVNMKNAEIASYSHDTLAVNNMSVSAGCTRVKWFLWNLDNIKPF